MKKAHCKVGVFISFATGEREKFEVLYLISSYFTDFAMILREDMAVLEQLFCYSTHFVIVSRLGRELLYIL